MCVGVCVEGYVGVCVCGRVCRCVCVERNVCACDTFSLEGKISFNGIQLAKQIHIF